MTPGQTATECGVGLEEQQQHRQEGYPECPPRFALFLQSSHHNYKVTEQNPKVKPPEREVFCTSFPGRLLFGTSSYKQIEPFA